MGNYDLEERTFKFEERTNCYVRILPRTITNIENGKQLVRSSGSVGANYIEANEALSRKDFVMRIKICKKNESKEKKGRKENFKKKKKKKKKKEGKERSDKKRTKKGREKKKKKKEEW